MLNQVIVQALEMKWGPFDVDLLSAYASWYKRNFAAKFTMSKVDVCIIIYVDRLP